MLSREERIFSELLLERGLVARDLIERYAQTRSEPRPSLAEFVIDSGEVEKDHAEQVLSEARAIDEALLPHLREGMKLGEFRLLREIGRGGMGIVYEAEQESLGRRVAVKVLPAGAALDERLAIRFLREARVTSRLQHPGIVPIFASGREEGVLFFAMELVPGRSLAEVVLEGPMEPERAARVISQVARALDHAHQAGLVHRDVKPENILLTEGDRARLTDFGLVHENVTGPFTLPRHVLGTPAYIAPEQALGGEAVDPRSDIYGVGAVLYTLLSGKPPYAGEVPSAVLSRVLSGPPPPLLSLYAGIPASLAAICERAMARRTEDRYGNAGEMAEALEAFLRGEAGPARTVPAGATVPAPRWRGITRVLGALAAIAAALVIARTAMRRGQEAPVAVDPLPSPRFVLVNSTPGIKASPSLSPDGKLLAYASRTKEGWGVYLEDLTSHDATHIDDSAGYPAFSPDGRNLAFEAHGVSLLDLEKRSVRRLGGPSYGALAWSPDGREIIVADGSGPIGEGSIGRIWAIDVASRRVRVARSMTAQDPAYSPHGLRIAFVSFAGGRSDVWTVPPDGGDAVRLTDDPAADWSPIWSRDGRSMYFGSDRGGTPGLFRVGVDEASGRAIGIPEPALRTVFPAAFFATLSADGRRMAIVNHGEGRGRLFRFPLDPDSGTLSSRPEALPTHAAPGMSPQPSPDGKSLVYTALSPEEDLAIVSTDGQEEPRLLTSDEFEDRAPRWSPDGKQIAFHSNRSGGMEIWTVRSDGSELRRITRTSNGNAVFPVWSPDGTRLAYSVEGIGSDIIAMPGATVSEPGALPPPEAGLRPFEPWSWSPDGTTLAGSADGVVLYSIPDRSYRRVTRFGEKPVWLHDGRRLLFADNRTLWIVDCKGGEPREVYSAAPGGLPPFLGVSADGRSIYVSLTSSNEEIWLADLPK